MKETEHSPKKQEKKIIKKYILHQKVNPRLLGVELFNSYLITPHEAYLSCKLIFKKDIQSLMELEQVAKRVREIWAKKNDELLIKKINVFASPAYIVLTFTIGFFDQEQVKYLRVLKECTKEILETYDQFVKQEQDAQLKRKEEEIHGIIEKCSQLTQKIEGLENRLIKNESIVLGSGELLKNELTKVSQTIKKQMNQAENKMKESQKNSENKEQTDRQLTHKNAESLNKAEAKEESPLAQKYILEPSKQLPTTLEIKNKEPIRAIQKDKIKIDEPEKKTFKKPIPKIELEILKCFTGSGELSKKRMIPKKQFLTLKAKVEFIDYLWMLLELEGKDEIIIAGKLSCRELIKDLGPFMETVEIVVLGSTIFNYWVYCSEELLVKLEGYAALKNLLSNYLKLTNDSISTILINES